MNVILCFPTLNRFDTLSKAIQTANDGSRKPDRIYVMDNSGLSCGSVNLHIDYLTKIHDNVTIIAAAYNWGCAKSWNYFMQYCSSIGDEESYVIISNDDVEFHKDTIKSLVEAAENSDDWFFCGNGASGNAFSLFLLKQEGFKALGPFDEEFYPAYFEDNDMARRLELAGQKLNRIESATYDHTPSRTIAAMNKQEQAKIARYFEDNRRYYIKKWGGLPHEEIYETPFDE